jgi:tetratricopeptide (TPR) repeat protein
MIFYETLWCLKQENIMNVDIAAAKFDDDTAKDLLLHLYTTYLMRTPDEIGLAFYLPVIKDFGLPGYIYVVNSVINSSEMKTIFTHQLKEIWIKYFDREPEEQEIENYKDLIRFYRDIGLEQIDEKINRAKQLSENVCKLNDAGQHEQAERLLDESQKECIAGFWQYWHEFGRAQYGQGKFEASVLTYQKSIKFNRDDEWYWSCEDLKWIYQELAKNNPEKYRDALLYFLHVVDQFPNRWAAWHECGHFAWKLKDYQNAISYYQEAINRSQKKPSWEWSAIDLANCYREAGLTTEAYEYFIDLTKRQSHCWGHWHARAWVEWNLNNKDPKAIDSYRKAIELNENGGWVWSWNDLGYCLFELRQYHEAKDAFKHASEKEPYNSDIWLNLGRTAKKLQQWDLAYEHLSRSIELNQNSIVSWHSLGNYYAYKPDAENLYAWLAYQKALKLSPRNSEVISEIEQLENRYQVELRKFIYTSFDLAEFKIFCYDIGIYYDDLSGDTLPERQISLIKKCFDSRKESQLIMQLQIDRQNKLPSVFHSQYFKLT